MSAFTLVDEILIVDLLLVLFKLKPGVSQEQIDGFCEAGRQMVGKIDGEFKYFMHPSRLCLTGYNDRAS